MCHILKHPFAVIMYKISIEPEDLEKLELGYFTGEVKVIDHYGIAFLKAIDYLKKQTVIGFDTESRPCFEPHHKSYGVSLLQLSGQDKAFLFRVKKMGMHKKLCRLLANENILKVGAAVADDIRGLQRYNYFEAGNFVDLQKIAWEWGIKDKSVKKLTANILGFRISKTQQLSNWEAEPLTDAQIRYASTDAWVCRQMYIKLLESEKHPLTPEQLAPPPPPQQTVEEKNLEENNG